MEEVRLLKLIDNTEKGLTLNDLSDILGEKESELKELIDKLIANGILSNSNGRYIFSNDRYHLGKIDGKNESLKLITKDKQNVSSDFSFCQKGDYVIYTTSRNMRYRIVYNIPVNKNKIGEISTIDGINYLVSENEKYEINDNTLINETMVEYTIENGNVKIISVLGAKDTPMTAMKILALEYGIITDYPDEVKKESEFVTQEVKEKDIIGRIDLRNDYTITIDNIDTNDIDDAIYYVGKNVQGNDVIRVSIADVPNYVINKTATDLHAKKVTTSVYTPDGGAFHMYHPKLSKGICSLNPNVDRLARTYEIAINQKGHIIMSESKMYLSVIRSKKKMDKDTVNKIFSGVITIEDDTLKENLLELNRISKEIRKRRIRGGLIDFPSCDFKFILDENGEVVDFKRHKSTEAADMIEDLMLVTGEFQGKLFEANGIKGMFRVEEAPDSEKIDEIIDALELQDVHIRKSSNYTSKDIQYILDKIKNKHFYYTFSQKLIRAMTKAQYSTVNIGHFGLSLPVYAQCTSPIRRCDDGENHRLDYKYLDNDNKQPYGEVLKLQALADHLNEEEIRVKKFERAADKYFIARYKNNFVDNHFIAHIFDFKKDGIEILLPDMTEGFIRYTDANIKVYNKSKSSIKITSFNESAILKIGDKISVILTESDLTSRKVYYRLDEKVLIKKK